jgi:hypothetical protein
MELPRPQSSWLVRQTNDQPPPQMDPETAAEHSKVLWAYYDAHWKAFWDEHTAKEAARMQSDSGSSDKA